MTLRDAAQQALESICAARLCEFNSMSSRSEMVRLMGEAADALRAALSETCTWSQDDEGASWDTGCEQLFDIIDGTPSDNQMEFCCYCGKPIDEIDYVKEVADDNA